MKPLLHLEIVSASSDASRGAFANAGIAKGETICVITFEVVMPTPSRYTVQIGDEAHVRPLPEALQSINHGCDPNVWFDVEHSVLRALRKIDAGEELRYFYPSTEWKMAEAFECRCGAAGCLGLIEGASRVSTDILNRYELAPHIRTRLLYRVDAS